MQRDSRAVYGREVLHMLQFSRACTIQSVRCNKGEREREEENVKETEQYRRVKMDKNQA